MKRWLIDSRLEQEAIMATKNQPVKEVRLGRIKAVIWKNPGSNGNGLLFNTRIGKRTAFPCHVDESTVFLHDF